MTPSDPGALPRYVVAAQHVSWTIGKNPGKTILHDCSLTVAPGERVALVGRSGAGKSTLLNIVGLLQRPTGGALEVCGVDIPTTAEKSRNRLRRSALGFVFQSSHLIDERTVVDNVKLALYTSPSPRHTQRAMIREVLAQVGLTSVADSLARSLSGGERQRVALARALVHGPELLLCDEPTGNLDSDSTEQVLELLATINEQRGTAMIIVTHEADVAAWADRTIVVNDGRTESVVAA